VQFDVQHTLGRLTRCSPPLSFSYSYFTCYRFFLLFFLLDVQTSRPSVPVLTLVYAYVQTTALFHRGSPVLASRYNRSIDPETELLRYAKQILHRCTIVVQLNAACRYLQC